MLTFTRTFDPEKEGMNYFGELAVRGDDVYCTGGAYSAGFLLHSTDAGRTFERLPAPTTTGLREILVENGTIWLAGESGLVASSSDRGATWTTHATESTSCVYAMTRDTQGRLWIGGQSALLMRDDGAGFVPVKSRVKDNVFDIYIDPQDGKPWLCGISMLMRYTGKSFKPVKTLATAPSIAEILRTHTGALVAAGRDGIVVRSEDDGEKWKKVKVDVKSNFEAMAHTPYGLFVCGEKLHVSHDDGRTFQTLAANTGHIWAIARVPGGLVVGADRGLFRIPAGELATMFVEAHGSEPELVALAQRITAGDDGAELVFEDALRERALY